MIAKALSDRVPESAFCIRRIMFKFVLMDLDDTLLDFHSSEAWALKNALSSLGIEPNEKIVARYSEINDSLWKKLEQGKITRARLLTERFEILFSDFGVDCSAHDAWKAYESYLSKTHFFVPQAKELLEDIYKDYELYIVSNGTASVQHGRIECSKISKYFKDIFISQEIGINKPQKEFFDYCFGRIPNFSNDKAIIVGDSLTSDIKGGNNALIKTCWFNPNKKERTVNVNIDYEITNLLQLKEILK